jgi:hypothetical protein
MKKGKIYKTVILGIFILAILSLLIITIRRCFFAAQSVLKEPVVTVSDEDKKKAIIVAKEFCKRLNINCEGPTSFENTFVYTFRHGRTFTEKPSVGDINIFIGRKKESGISQPHVFLSIGRKSMEVEGYDNRGLRVDYEKRYLKQIRGSEVPKVKWPEFMSEDKARKILDSIAAKIPMPGDMKFDRMEKNTKEGVWHAFWVRTKDGYRYEGDGAVITIMGATGAFVAYRKIDLLTAPAITEVNISKEKAIELGWTKLLGHVPRKVRGKAKEIYRVKAELLIIPVGKFESSAVPVKIQGARLAWVINYVFTGGLVSPMTRNSSYSWTEEEQKAVKTYLIALEKRWNEMGRPERDFEIRIDVASGEILYVSPISSRLGKWFLK